MRCQRKTSKPRIKHHPKIKYQVAKGGKKPFNIFYKHKRHRLLHVCMGAYARHNR
jgi:hypothetical protein